MNHLVTRVGAATAVALALLAIGGVASRVDAGSPQGSSSPPRDQAGTAKAKGGGAPSKPTSPSEPSRTVVDMNDEVAKLRAADRAAKGMRSG